MKTKYKLVAAALLLATAAYYYITWDQDLERYTDMYQRGHYQAVRDGLRRKLEQNPTWHQARKLLTEVELAAGQPVAAVEQLVLLIEAGQVDEEFEQQFVRALRKNLPGPETAGNCLALLLPALDDHPHWSWLHLVGLHLAVKAETTETLASLLLGLDSETVNQYGSLVSQAWNQLLSNSDLLDCMAMAEFADANWDNRLSYRFQVFHHFDLQQQLPSLQPLYPENALLAMALVMYTDTDLDWLLEWERQYAVEDEFASWYSSNKTDLLLQAPEITPDHLANILPQDLLTITINCSNREIKQVILKKLEQARGPDSQIQLAQLSLDAPEPQLRLVHTSTGSLSPNGRWLCYRTVDGQWKIINLDSRTVTTLAQSEHHFHHWSPDSNRVAFIGPETLAVYSVQGELVAKHELKRTYTDYGWFGNRHLLVYSEETGYSLLDVAGGQLEQPGWLPEQHQQTMVICSSGKAAWVIPDGIKVWDGRDLTTLELPPGWQDIWLVGWLGDDLLVENNQIYLLSLAREATSLAIESIETILVSRTGDEVYYLKPVHQLAGIIVSRNLATGRDTSTGIIGYAFSIAGNRMLVHRQGALEIYQLP